MPISNGYEACTKILKLFNKDQIFRVESSNNLNINDLSCEIKNRRMSSQNVLPNKIIVPQMVACSSEVQTDELVLKIESLGFNQFFSVPLKSEQIKNEIIPLLLNRKKKIEV
jgi:hypothetical protein